MKIFEVMSDWSMYELEDIVWDEFRESGDHIVPQPSAEQGGCDARSDSRKKPRRDSVTDAKQSPGSKSVAKDATQRKDETSFLTMKEEKVPMLENRSWSPTPDGVFRDMCDNDIKEENTDDTNMSDNRFKSSNIHSIDNELSQKEATIGTGDAAVGGNLCCFSLDDISPTESDLGFYGSAREDKDSGDLLYYGWPDIGNFEDVDRMFRSCDATFGVGTAGDEEPSWFSSGSHAFSGSEDAFKAGFKSSNSESSALNSTSKHYDADMKFMPETVPPLIIDSDENNVTHGRMSSQMLDAAESASVGQCFENWLNTDSEDKRELLSNKQAHELNLGVEVKMSEVNQIDNENGGIIDLEGKRSQHRNQFEGRTDQISQHLTGDSIHGHNIVQQSGELHTSVPPAAQVFPAPPIAQQEKNLGSDSFGYLHTYIPCVNVEYNHPRQIPVMPATSSIKTENNCHPSLSSKASSYASSHAMPMKISSGFSPKSPATKTENTMKRFFRQQQAPAPMSIDPQQEVLGGRAAYTDQIPIQKQLHQILDENSDEVERAHFKLPAAVDSSTMQEGSCVSSTLSDDISLEAATTFRQFQYVTEKLDVRTKLCIRDSLYRLARNAAQRCNSGNIINCASDSKDKNRLLTPGESDRYTGFIDIETDTNPIDRSIAYLLFHRPSSDPSSRSPNNGLAPIHGPILSHQPLIPGKAISLPDLKILLPADQSQEATAEKKHFHVF